MRYFVQLVMVLNLFFLSSHTAFAEQVKCPSIDELSAFHYEVSFPYGYDQSTKGMRAIVIATPHRHVDEEYDETEDRVLVLYPTTIAPNEKPQQAMRSLIRQLKLDHADSLSYRLGGDDSIEICAYVLPGNEHINGLLYIDNQEVIEPNESFRQQNHPRLMAKLTQQLNLKTILQS